MTAFCEARWLAAALRLRGRTLGNSAINKDLAKEYEKQCSEN